MSMFRNRKNSQKVDEELIRRFQQTFPHVGQRRGSKIAPESAAINTGIGDPTIYSGFEVDMVDSEHRSTSEDDMKLCSDWTPWDLQPLSIPSPCTDLGWMSTMPASQHFGFNTPSSCKMDTVLGSWAGDLHTPTLGVSMITPQSFSNVNPTMLHNFRNSGLEKCNPPLLGQRTPALNPDVHQTAYASSSVMHRDSGNAAHGESIGVSLPDEMQLALPSNAVGSTDFSDQAHPSCTKDGTSRYNVLLQAPAAMVKHAQENPVTYLNKGQSYTLTVKDSTPPITNTESIKYRTFIRISFEGEEERSNPAERWKLWMNSRGKGEEHQRGGELLAVEYVNHLQSSGEDSRDFQVGSRQTFLDGFCVKWTGKPSDSISSCSISVRFNFLSTDFSLSKGVKGIPVRLCAKTELLSSMGGMGEAPDVELCYCKVKLFRDHGADRKSSNDLAHVNRTIERLENQIAEIESGVSSTKRKRGNTVSASKSMGPQVGALDKMSIRDGLQTKLASMRGILSSTRPVSVLDLRGNEEDDPDFHPIRLPNNGTCVKVKNQGRQNSGSSILSLNDFNKPPNSPRMDLTQVYKPPIETLDIDQSYQAPLRSSHKPIACFYVRLAGGGEHSQNHYRAIYLMERTVQELMEKISVKYQINLKRIVRIVHTNKKGLRIMVDDEFVRELREGHDMIADICDVTGPECSDASHGGSLLVINLTY